jgi:hypothetical protein
LPRSTTTSMADSQSKALTISKLSAAE